MNAVTSDVMSDHDDREKMLLTAANIRWILVHYRHVHALHWRTGYVTARCKKD